MFKIISLINWNFSLDLNFIKSRIFSYLKLTKPGVVFLVAFCAFCSMIIAIKVNNFQFNYLEFIRFFIAFLGLIGGSASTAIFNMWYDRDIDALMERTKKRPIPSGKIKPHSALAFCILLGLISLFLTYFYSNGVATIYLAFGMFCYSFIYTTFLKRRTAQNIVIGGAAGAISPMIGWSIVSPVFNLDSFIMFLIIFLWTPPHFWALAIYNKKNYDLAKIPMLPNTKGIQYTKKSILFYIIFLSIVTFVPFIAGFHGYLYFSTAFVMNLFFFKYAISLLSCATTHDNIYAKKLFLFSLTYLFVIFLAMVVS